MANDNAGGISGVAVAAVFAGGLLAWSGVKGYKLSYVTQDLLSGKDPSQDPRIPSSALTVSPGGLFGGLFGGLASLFGGSSSGAAGGNTSTSGLPSVSTQSGSGGRYGSAFAKSLLATLGAPQTPANIASIEAWARREGGGGANNPLNTTLGSRPGQPQFPGATVFNSAGVMNFANFAQGVMANAAVIMEPAYADILAALKSGNGLCGRSFASLGTWSGGGYTSVC